MALQSRSIGIHGRGTSLALIAIVFTSLALATVIGRLYYRSTNGRTVGRDDAVIAFSMLFSGTLCVFCCIGVAHGIGKHVHTLSLSDIHISLITFWLAQLFYKLTINATKLSILLLYTRLFPSPRLRLVCRLLMTYVCLYAFASVIATVFECWPVERVWDKSVKGRCIDLTAFWYANAVQNLVADVVVLAVPVPVVRRVQVAGREKVGLYLLFGLGIFVCITSFLRMTTLSHSSKNPDTTYGTMTSTTWTVVEANTAIICACLPTLRAPLSTFFRRLLPSILHSSSSPSPTTSSPHLRRSGYQHHHHHSSTIWGRRTTTTERGLVEREGRAPAPDGEWKGPTMTTTTVEGDGGVRTEVEGAGEMSSPIPLRTIEKRTDVCVRYCDSAGPEGRGEAGTGFV